MLQPVEVDVRGVLAQVVAALGDDGARIELDGGDGRARTPCCSIPTG